jgi:PAS domain S-box-containing protein
VAVAYVRNPRTFGATRLLLAVVAIDTGRNIVENLYFGLYFGAKYGLFPGAIVGVLGNPNLLIIPKVINVAAACAVLGLLLLRWLPTASQERASADHDLRKKSDALMQETEERRQLFDTSLDLILIADRQGNLVRVSPSSLGTLGYSPDEMAGRSAVEFVYPADLEATRTEMRLARTGQHTRNFETRYVHKNGRIVALAWSGVWSEPEQKHFFVGRDMTEQKVAEERLRHLAHYDQLTGLANRVSLQSELEELLKPRAGADERATSIAMFDLDGFKDINDTLGHSTGDQLLQEVAQRLAVLVNGTARAYRLGGDEFVLVIPDCGDPREVGQVGDA